MRLNSCCAAFYRGIKANLFGSRESAGEAVWDGAEAIWNVASSVSDRVISTRLEPKKAVIGHDHPSTCESSVFMYQPEKSFMQTVSNLHQSVEWPSHLPFSVH